MPQIAIDVSFKEIERIIDTLKIKEKVKIFEKLGKETRKGRWGNLLNRIENRYKKYPISDKEITSICKEVRKNRYEKRPNSSY